MAAKERVTAGRLQELMHYDPRTGVFTRKITVGGKRAGSLAGTGSGHGYCHIVVDGRGYGAHRLAFLYMTGNWPPDQVDHRDGNRSNNGWSNLRAATVVQQRRNSARRSDNESGYKGVCRHQNTAKWRAYIVVSGRQKHLGFYATKSEAAEAYQRAADQLFGEFARAA